VFCRFHAWLNRLELRIEQVAASVIDITDGTTPVDVQAMQVREEFPSGTYPSIAGSQSFTIRALNTVQYNTISGASLVNRIIVLPAGTYYFNGSAPAFSTMATRLYLVTPPVPYVDHIIGTNEYSSGSQIGTKVEGFVTFTAETGVCLLHWIQSGGTATNLGKPMMDDTIEVYSSLTIWKLA